MSSILAQLDQLTKSLKAWSGSTLDLFLLEMKVNVSAVRQILLCTVVFTLLSVLFVFSLCLASGGVVAYQLTANVYVAVGVFITSLGLALFALAWWQKRLVGFLGFKNTTEQLQEGGWDALATKAQSSHADQADGR
ncbi:putative membrane protein [Vibrio sp. JCM 18904]|nr:putative membrane protein [Vibrio sp. JCM 18904]